MTTEQRPAHLIDQVMRRCKQQHIELPADGRIQRSIDSVLRQFETQLYASTRDAMDALIRETDELLSTFTFQGTTANASVIEALHVLKELNEAGKRIVPENAPTDFVKGRWEKHVVQEEQI